MNYYKEIKKLQERVSKLENKRFICEEEPTKDVREKITLKEFFDGNKDMCIHCDTEEKANILLKEFHKMGKEWGDRTTYLTNNRWSLYKSNTCYSNYGTCCDLDWYMRINVKVYEFEDVIFEEEKVTCGKFTEDEKVILRNLPEEFKWIARDENGTLYITVRKPKKDKYGWLIYNGVNMFLFKNLFKSIQWEDEEPCEFRNYL